MRTAAALAAAVVVASIVCLPLPDELREAQAVFDRTGGLHAAALFDADGRAARGARGRGPAQRDGQGDRLPRCSRRVPLARHILMVSGRAELRAGAEGGGGGGPGARARCRRRRAWQCERRGRGMTLVGFVRDERFNVYTGARAHRPRVLVPPQFRPTQLTRRVGEARPPAEGGTFTGPPRKGGEPAPPPTRPPAGGDGPDRRAYDRRHAAIPYAYHSTTRARCRRPATGHVGRGARPRRGDLPP